jgi:hypothetical protein
MDIGKELTVLYSSIDWLGTLNTEMIRITVLLMIYDCEIWISDAIRDFRPHSIEWKRACICSWGISFHTVYIWMHKVSRVVGREPGGTNSCPPYSRHFRWVTCLVNVQAREAVIPVLQRRLAQSSPHVARHCPAETWNVELSEEEAVPQTLNPL